VVAACHAALLAKNFGAVFAASFVIRHSRHIPLIPGTSSLEHLTENGADGISDVEGKVARVAMSELGNERISIIAISLLLITQTFAAAHCNRPAHPL
jgi:hypothetical protein